jgi:3-oxoadipate enol-lactonase
VNALGPDASPELVGEIFAYRRSAARGLSPWLAQAAAGAWFGITGRSGAIAAPTLVVHGSADNVVDPRNGRLLADGIPWAPFVDFEDAGHLLYWEHPERFTSVVGGFLAD